MNSNGAKRHLAAAKQRQDPVRPKGAKGILAFAACIVLLAALAAAGHFGFFHSNSAKPVAADMPPPVKVVRMAQTLDDLLKMPAEILAYVDIAEMNLLCAAGLAGAEGMDINKCLARLDQWAQRVKMETERHLYRLTDPRYADHTEHYQHSEARFRAEWLVSILQQDIGLHYHAGFVPQDVAVVPLKTSKEAFLHGLMDDEDAHKAFGGNCVSLPVAYVAVGRRLGYPVKLACSKEHTFCRWEGEDHPNPAWRDRFNFDSAGNGFSIDPDSFYLSWPRKSTSDLVELCDWLKSLTPQEELALFMANRGHVLTHVSKDFGSALVAFSHCARLWPSSRSPLQEVQQSLDRLWTREVAAHPEIYRQRYGVEVVDERVVPVRQASRKSDTLAEIEMINAINRRNMERLMQPAVPTPGVPQPPSPYGPQPGVPWPYQPPGQLPR
jgi:hypothetical protein